MLCCGGVKEGLKTGRVKDGVLWRGERESEYKAGVKDWRVKDGVKIEMVKDCAAKGEYKAGMTEDWRVKD